MTTGVLEQIRGGVIVSVQADEGEPLYPKEILGALALSVLSGGACGLRMANPDNIAYVKSLRPDVPVIGITKPSKIPANFLELVYITPTWADVAALAEAGTEIVALDATLRPRSAGESVPEIVEKTRKNYPNLLLMADIATLEDGLEAERLGFDLISTTLSGYTTETRTKASEGPDFELLRKLVEQTRVPIIMEGRIWTPEEAALSFASGARAVVVGSAITRPHHITRRFVDAAGKPSNSLDAQRV